MKVSVQGKNQRFVNETLKILRKYDFEISDDPDILISVGGDGSTLYNYKKFERPILPVRTPESLGYISDIGIENLEMMCEKLIEKSFYVEKRILLDLHKNKIILGSAINDITMLQIPEGAMRYSVFADGKPLFGYEKIMGDGVITATPTGSTAYNRSAGGYVLDPSSKKFVVTLRYPVFIESQEEKSKIVDENSVIEFKFYRPEEAILLIDTKSFKIKNSDEIVVKKSDKTFDLVRIIDMEEERSSKEKRRKEWFEKQLF